MRQILISCLILLAFISFDTPQPAQAGAITVNGSCTLVDAIIAANTDAPSGNCPAGSGPDVITLDVDMMVTTPYQDFLGLPPVTSDITIQAGIGNTISGDNSDILLFLVNSATARLTLDGITIENFRALSQYDADNEISFAAYGSAIAITDSSAEVYVNNSIIQQNSAVGIIHPDGFGQDVFGGAIYNEGYLEINNSVLQNNTASAVNGEINPKFAAGGAIYNQGTLIVQSSIIDSNHVESSHPFSTISAGGGIASLGILVTIRDSTISNNSVTSTGGEILITIGGGLASDADTIIERSLFVQNSALENVSNQGLGGAIYLDLDVESVSITNSTFYQNISDVGGAMVLWEVVGTGSHVSSFNTFAENSSVVGGDAIVVATSTDMIFSGNIITSSSPLQDCYNLTAANGSTNLNLAGDTSCDVISSGNIIPGTHFATILTDEGLGVPEFLPLLNVANNPAVNAVAGCGLTEDQRGFTRDSDCDVGSYELQEPPVSTDTPVPPTDTPLPPTDTPIPLTDTSVPPTDTPGPSTLVTYAVCVDENLVVTISAGDGPFDITASAGINTPVNGVGIGTTTINGPEKWDNLTVVETTGDQQSVNLGKFKCRTDERPVPLTPAHRSRTTNPFPVFSWTSISIANNYRVFVFDNKVAADRTVDIRQNSGGPTSMTLSTPLPDGRLFWRVRGRQNRVWSLWSVRFTLFKDPVAPLTASTPVPTVDMSGAPTLAPQATVAPTFPAPPNSR